MKSLGKNVLLDLHGQVLDQEGGYWVKIEAWEVEATASIPHGIRYSLTLHNPRGVRILGYDNAHATKFAGYANRKLPYDHKHRCATDLGTSYDFKNAYQLLKDFFEDVDKTLRLARDK
ncbi:toxin-antitoxin system TumE family protein [Polynucleobacter bastaniensis]|jgi:hypothetical protein|uniref:toxin-antitoxin system TumE family protein n=1 Tax=Polynucleobacter bastaniensis TaxID=2081039 RepID=UPI001C0B3E4A|nr:DUF6516 family protein [Polynucleobacter bastaniensis]MBU3598684.1 hypothetical protein [Polynucleobacter bastaniensis]